jgi:subtilisin-like proprotein convertase family protein
VDADGSVACVDCDDTDAANAPDNAEVCDGGDNDCDPLTFAADEDVDVDADGAPLCLDCDDAEAASFPGNPEICDNLDNDCDGAGDGADADGDGFAACSDCDDNDAAVNPSAAEACDGVDTDCDPNTTLTGDDTDADGDGSWACADCDDTDDANLPGGTEICDGSDNDCDANTVFAGEDTDVDGDGAVTCEDCDDDDANTAPEFPELCDGIDNDCRSGSTGTWDLGVDPTSTGGTYDQLRGNMITPTANMLLTSFQSYVAAAPGRELQHGVWEGATESGDFELIATATTTVPWSGDGQAAWHDSGGLGVDLQSDMFYVLATWWGAGSNVTFHRAFSVPDAADVEWLYGAAADEQAVLPQLFDPIEIGGYGFGMTVTLDDEADGDGDGSLACADCDDSNASAAPSLAEVCDDADTDCDPNTWAPEEDGDGDTDGFPSCLDCNDGDAAINPAAAEACDGVDTDCNGTVDFDLDGEVDADADGSLSCADCDDSNAAVAPNQPEACDGLDTDCNGSADFDAEGEVDVDGDSSVSCADCDDADATRYPGAPELCNEVDDDCDGSLPADEFDLDSDTFLGCDECDDANASAFPNAPDGVCDGVDLSCDGLSSVWITPDDNGQATGADRVRGNIIVPDYAVTVDGFSMKLDPDTPQTLQLAVWESVNNSNSFTLISGVEQVITGQMDDIVAVYTYEGLDLALVPGRSYLFGGWWPNNVRARRTGSADDPTWGSLTGGAVQTNLSNMPSSVSTSSVGHVYWMEIDTGLNEEDLDADGSFACADCDDAADVTYPGAPELCDGSDNDCDGSANADADGEVDADADGYLSCDDCEDSSAAAFPGGIEVCDGLDNDCDGSFLSESNWVTSSVGSTTLGDGITRGTVVLATEDTALSRYRQRVDVNNGGLVTIAIYEGTSVTGPWTLKAQTDIVATTNSYFWAETGYVHVPVTAGLYYAGVAWMPEGGKFRHAGPSANYGDIGFGEVAGAFETTTNQLDVWIDESTDATNAMHGRFYWGLEADADGDGVSTCAGDCNDADASIMPGGAEVCDGVDNDCTHGADDMRITATNTEDRTVNSLATGGRSVEVDAWGTVADVNVSVNVSVPNSNDQTRVRLVSPSGTQVILHTSSATTFRGPLTDSRFDDEASVTHGNNGSPWTGTWQPTGTLASFDGEEVHGTWTVQLFHGAIHGPATLEDWTLEITLESDDTGTSEPCAAASCQDILESDPSATHNEVYWLEDIDDGTRYQTLCDMSNDGGGWTLVASVNDDQDPYFGGHSSPFFGSEWVEAWESDSTRNASTIATFSAGADVSTKYRSFGDLPVNDVRIHYSIGDRFFLCEGLNTPKKLHEVFSMTPNQDQCNASCSTWSQDRFTSVVPVGPTAGLNCSDGNEAWYTSDQNAENARIGARHDQNTMAGFLGTMGDRGFDTSTYEKTWANGSEGVTHEEYVLLFVR